MRPALTFPARPTASLRCATRCATLCAVLCASLLAACGQSPVIQLYQLRAEPPQAVATRTEGAAVWQLLPLQLPSYLDREAVLQPQGQAGLGAVPGARWAEPLRDAVPRLLLADLASLRGASSVFIGPLPPGLKAQQQLRVELTRLDAEADGSAVVLTGRWWLQDPSGASAPQVHELRLRAPASGTGVEGLVAAHRQVLWQLAQAIASGR